MRPVAVSISLCVCALP